MRRPVEHQLAIGIHAGSTYRHAPMASGWSAHRVEDYVAQSAAFESQLLSFLAEGVFQQFHRCGCAERIGLHLAAEPAVANQQILARHARRGALDRPLAGRDHPRARSRDPAAGGIRRRAIRKRSCAPWNTSVPTACCCFSTDYPHWQFDGDAVLPDGLSDETVRRILIDNPLETYPRLQDGAQISDNAASKKEAVR